MCRRRLRGASSQPPDACIAPLKSSCTQKENMKYHSSLNEFPFVAPFACVSGSWKGYVRAPNGRTANRKPFRFSHWADVQGKLHTQTWAKTKDVINHSAAIYFPAANYTMIRTICVSSAELMASVRRITCARECVCVCG